MCHCCHNWSCLFTKSFFDSDLSSKHLPTKETHSAERNSLRYILSKLYSKRFSIFPSLNRVGFSLGRGGPLKIMMLGTCLGYRSYKGTTRSAI